MAYPITATLSLTEDKNLAAIHLLLQKLDQAGVLVALLYEEEVLCYSVVRFQLR